MLSVVLIGKTGLGKSSTGNSILGNDGFTASSSASRFTKKSELIKHKGELEGGHKITVIDGLDVCYCGENADFTNVEKALSLSGTGINAFLMVVKYGDGFTEDAQKVVKMTKAIFGNDVIKNFGILVFTHGDNFKKETADGEKKLTKFEDWLEKQTGEIKQLYNEVGKRVVLFDNKAKEDKDKKDQVHKLSQIINRMKKEIKRQYNNDDYKKAENDRNTLQLNKISLQRSSECDDFISEIKVEISEEVNNIQGLEEKKNTLEDYAKTVTLELGEKNQNSQEMISKINTAIYDVNSKVMPLQEKNKQTQPQLSQLHIQSEQGVNNNCIVKNDSRETGAKRQRDQYEKGTEMMETNEAKILINCITEVEKNEERLITSYRKILQCKELDEKMGNEITAKLQFLEQYQNSNAPKKPKLMDGPNVDIEAEVDESSMRKFLKPNEVTLLLVGSAGNGKSATGNTIIGKQVFQKTASTSSSSDATFTKYCADIGDKVVTVVDGPGVNTELSPEDIIKSSILSVKNALELCEYNFSALLIVLKYGSRFTKQESENIKIIKGILGEDVIKKYGICIVTHGDNFDADFEDENIQFIDWCRQQKGDIQNLFEECSYRCVLFNNRTKDETMKSFQVSQVLQFASTGKHFSLDDFMAAFQGMQKLKLEYELPRIIDETNEFIKQKRKEMENVKLSNDKSSQCQTYEVIKNEVKQYEQELTEKYVDTELIKQPLQIIKIAVMELNSKINNLGAGERYPGVASASGNKSHCQALESHPLKDGFLDQGEFSDSYDKQKNTSTSYTEIQGRQSMYNQCSPFSVREDLQPCASLHTYQYLPTAQQVTHGYSQKASEKTDPPFVSSYGDLSAIIWRDIDSFEKEIKDMNLNNQNEYKWEQLFNKLEKYEKEKKEWIQSLNPDVQFAVDEKLNYVRGAIAKNFKPCLKLYLKKMWHAVTLHIFST